VESGTDGQRLFEQARAKAHDIGQGIAPAEDGRTATPAEHTLLAGRRLEGLQKVVSAGDPEGGHGHRNDRCERSSLCLAALEAVAYLNRFERRVDVEGNAAAQAAAGEDRGFIKCHVIAGWR
jgi:hypothetical protein